MYPTTLGDEFVSMFGCFKTELLEQPMIWTINLREISARMASHLSAVVYRVPFVELGRCGAALAQQVVGLQLDHAG